MPFCTAHVCFLTQSGHPARTRYRLSLCSWQNELEHCASFLAGPRRKLTTMTLDNHPANCQSQPHSLRLCGNECIKYAAQFLWINSRSRVFNCYDNFIAGMMLSSHQQHPASVLDSEAV